MPKKIDHLHMHVADLKAWREGKTHEELGRIMTAIALATDKGDEAGLIWRLAGLNAPEGGPGSGANIRRPGYQPFDPPGGNVVDIESSLALKETSHDAEGHVGIAGVSTGAKIQPAAADAGKRESLLSLATPRAQGHQLRVEFGGGTDKVGGSDGGHQEPKMFLVDHERLLSKARAPLAQD